MSNILNGGFLSVGLVNGNMTPLQAYENAVSMSGFNPEMVSRQLKIFASELGEHGTSLKGSADIYANTENHDKVRKALEAIEKIDSSIVNAALQNTARKFGFKDSFLFNPDPSKTLAKVMIHKLTSDERSQLKKQSAGNPVSIVDKAVLASKGNIGNCLVALVRREDGSEELRLSPLNDERNKDQYFKAMLLEGETLIAEAFLQNSLNGEGLTLFHPNVIKLIDAKYDGVHFRDSNWKRGLNRIQSELSEMLAGKSSVRISKEHAPAEKIRNVMNEELTAKNKGIPVEKLHTLDGIRDNYMIKYVFVEGADGLEMRISDGIDSSRYENMVQSAERVIAAGSLVKTTNSVFISGKNGIDKPALKEAQTFLTKMLGSQYKVIIK